MVEMKEESDDIYVGEGMHHATKIMDRIEDYHKEMTELILQQTGVTTGNFHFPEAKKLRSVLG